MSVEENKDKIRRFVEEFWNKGNLESLNEHQAASYVHHDPGSPEITDREGFKQFAIMTRTGFPDFNVTIEDIIAEGDKVVTRWSVRGTHKGALGEIPPTGKEVTMTGITIDRIADGKVVEGWFHSDDLGFWQQLGVIPPMD